MTHAPIWGGNASGVKRKALDYKTKHSLCDSLRISVCYVKVDPVATRTVENKGSETKMKPNKFCLVNVILDFWT